MEYKYNMPLLGSFLDAPPTAELEPITESHIQKDEVIINNKIIFK